MSEKNEEPTAKRLRESKEKGQSGQSATLAQALGFMVAVALLPAVGSALAATCSMLLAQAMQVAASPVPQTAVDSTAIIGMVIAAVVPITAAVALTNSVGALVQTGGFIAVKKLIPKLDGFDVVAGLKNLVSMQRVVAMLRSMLGALFVAYLALRLLRTELPSFVYTAGDPRRAVVGFLVAGDMAQTVGIFGLALGGIDFFFVRRAWMAQLRMSKDEVKREHKENDGDPQLKAARERAHHELLAQATVGNVKQASVVVVNPTHLACALRYRDSANEDGDVDQAPVLVASGEGDLAKRIVEAARAYGIPILRDVPLARALRSLEVGEEVPEVLYEAVAEVLRAALDERTEDDTAAPG
jgi:flagellar biosynthesis protein FlhB